eukprot:6152823-Ditylum_brightwellii.AAC.1
MPNFLKNIRCSLNLDLKSRSRAGPGLHRPGRNQPSVKNRVRHVTELFDWPKIQGFPNSAYFSCAANRNCLPRLNFDNNVPIPALAVVTNRTLPR